MHFRDKLKKEATKHYSSPLMESYRKIQNKCNTANSRVDLIGKVYVKVSLELASDD